MSKQLTNLRARETEHFVMLEDLGRGFAHRVRNYLGIMSGTVQLCLSNYKMESEFEEQLKIVDQNVQDMLKSIEDFLGFARIPEMALQPLNPGEVLDGILKPLDAKLRSQKIMLKKKFDSALPQFKGIRR